MPWSDSGGTPLLEVSGGWLRGRILSRVPGREETGGDHTCFVLAPTAAGGSGAAGGSKESGRPLRMSDVQHIRPGQPAGQQDRRIHAMSPATAAPCSPRHVT